VGAFSAKFSTPPSGKTIDRTQKCFLKWWHGQALSPCKIWWKSRDARRRERTKCDVFKFIYFFFEYNAPEITVTDDLVALLQQKIALVFIGWFRCGLQRFFGEEKLFPAKKTDLEISARRRYHTCRNAWENCQSPRKWVQSLCAPLRPFKSEMKENFYNSILRHVL